MPTRRTGASGGTKGNTEGEQHSAALLLEIRAPGSTGAASTLRQFVRAWRPVPRHAGRRRQSEDDTAAAPCHRRYSPRQTRWIRLRPTKDLDEQERTDREALCQQSVTSAPAKRLVADFGQLVRTRAHTALDAWLATVARSHIPELARFVRGIRRDDAAVAAAFTASHSQGQVEGQVNRLKMLKHPSFGRANFELLRRRVLYYSP